MKRLFPKIQRVIAVLVLMTFTSTLITPPSAYSQTLINLPVPGTMIAPSSAMTPLLLKGLTVDVNDPLHFDFIIDSGHDQREEGRLKMEAGKLVKYFLAALTVPHNDLWVNLSPNEPDRIVPDELGKTELGRDMLAQDYLLKQLTASLMYPENELGMKFWQRIRERAKAEFGTDEITTETFNKVWIMPESAEVYEYENTVYVTKARLRVMLEEDYVGAGASAGPIGRAQGPARTEGNQLNAQIMRELVIPELEREVNEGEHFAPLRQIYHSLILAQWYKETVENSLLEKFYIDQRKVEGVSLRGAEGDEAISENQIASLPAVARNDSEVQQIYERYMQAFKKGVYDFIKDEYDPATQQIIPRKYFSGGEEFTKISVTNSVRADAIAPFTGQGLELGIQIADVAMLSRRSPEQREIDRTKIKALLDQGPHTAAEIAEKTGIYIKTVRKDLTRAEGLKGRPNWVVEEQKRRSEEQLQNDRAKIKRVLDQGPHSAAEIAEETGIDIKTVWNDLTWGEGLKDHLNWIVRKHKKDQPADRAMMTLMKKEKIGPGASRLVRGYFERNLWINFGKHYWNLQQLPDGQVKINAYDSSTRKEIGIIPSEFLTNPSSGIKSFYYENVGTRHKLGVHLKTEEVEGFGVLVHFQVENLQNEAGPVVETAWQEPLTAQENGQVSSIFQRIKSIYQDSSIAVPRQIILNVAQTAYYLVMDQNFFVALESGKNKKEIPNAVRKGIVLWNIFMKLIEQTNISTHLKVIPIVEKLLLDYEMGAIANSTASPDGKILYRFQFFPNEIRLVEADSSQRPYAEEAASIMNKMLAIKAFPFDAAMANEPDRAMAGDKPSDAAMVQAPKKVYTLFNLTQMVDRIAEIFRDPNRQLFPSTPELEQLTGVDHNMIWKNEEAIFEELEKKVNVGEYDEDRQRRITWAIKLKQDSGLGMADFIVEFFRNNPDVKTLPSVTELMKMTGLGRSRIAVIYPKVMTGLEARISALEFKDEDELGKRLGKAIKARRESSLDNQLKPRAQKIIKELGPDNQLTPEWLVFIFETVGLVTGKNKNVVLKYIKKSSWWKDLKTLPGTPLTDHQRKVFFEEIWRVLKGKYEDRDIELFIEIAERMLDEQTIAVGQITAAMSLEDEKRSWVNEQWRQSVLPELLAKFNAYHPREVVDKDRSSVRLRQTMSPVKSQSADGAMTATPQERIVKQKLSAIHIEKDIEKRAVMIKDFKALPAKPLRANQSGAISLSLSKNNLVYIQGLIPEQRYEVDIEQDPELGVVIYLNVSNEPKFAILIDRETIDSSTSGRVQYISAKAKSGETRNQLRTRLKNKVIKEELEEALAAIKNHDEGYQEKIDAFKRQQHILQLIDESTLSLSLEKSNEFMRIVLTPGESYRVDLEEDRPLGGAVIYLKGEKEEELGLVFQFDETPDKTSSGYVPSFSARGADRAEIREKLLTKKARRDAKISADAAMVGGMKIFFENVKLPEMDQAIIGTAGTIVAATAVFYLLYKYKWAQTPNTELDIVAIPKEIELKVQSIIETLRSKPFDAFDRWGRKLLIPEPDITMTKGPWTASYLLSLTFGPEQLSNDIQKRENEKVRTALHIAQQLHFRNWKVQPTSNADPTKISIVLRDKRDPEYGDYAMAGEEMKAFFENARLPTDRAMITQKVEDFLERGMEITPAKTPEEIISEILGITNTTLVTQIATVITSAGLSNTKKQQQIMELAKIDGKKVSQLLKIVKESQNSIAKAKKVDIVGFFQGHGFRKDFQQIEPALERVVAIAKKYNRPVIWFMEEVSSVFHDDMLDKLHKLITNEKWVAFREAVLADTYDPQFLYGLYIEHVLNNHARVTGDIEAIRTGKFGKSTDEYQDAFWKFLGRHKDIKVQYEKIPYEAWLAALKYRLNGEKMEFVSKTDDPQTYLALYERTLSNLNESGMFRDKDLREKQLPQLGQGSTKPIIIVLRGIAHCQLFDHFTSEKLRAMSVKMNTNILLSASHQSPFSWLGIRLLLKSDMAFQPVEQEYILHYADQLEKMSDNLPNVTSEVDWADKIDQETKKIVPPGMLKQLQEVIGDIQIEPIVESAEFPGPDAAMAAENTQMPLNWDFLENYLPQNDIQKIIDFVNGLPDETRLAARNGLNSAITASGLKNREQAFLKWLANAADEVKVVIRKTIIIIMSANIFITEEDKEGLIDNYFKVLLEDGGEIPISDLKEIARDIAKMSSDDLIEGFVDVNFSGREVLLDYRLWQGKELDNLQKDILKTFVRIIAMTAPGRIAGVGIRVYDVDQSDEEASAHESVKPRQYALDIHLQRGNRWEKAMEMMPLYFLEDSESGGYRSICEKLIQVIIRNLRINVLDFFEWAKATEEKEDFRERVEGFLTAAAQVALPDSAYYKIVVSSPDKITIVREGDSPLISTYNAKTKTFSSFEKNDQAMGAELSKYSEDDNTMFVPGVGMLNIGQAVEERPVWEALQPETGRRYFLKVTPSKYFHSEWVHYLLAKRLGCNVPSIIKLQPAQYLNVTPIKNEYGKHFVIQPEESFGILTTDVNSLSFEELNQKEGTGLEEFLLLRQLAPYTDISVLDLSPSNSIVRSIKGKDRYIIYDPEGNPATWLLNKDFAGFVTVKSNDLTDTWERFIGKIDPERLVEAVKRAQSITPTEVTAMAIESGYLPEEVNVEKFIKRQNRLVRGLLVILESIKKNAKDYEVKAKADLLGNVLLEDFAMVAEVPGGIDSAGPKRARGIDSSLDKEEVGGIDLNAIPLSHQGNKRIKINVDPQLLERMNNTPLYFTPVIINFSPLPSILPLLGLEDKVEPAYEVSQLN